MGDSGHAWNATGEGRTGRISKQTGHKGPITFMYIGQTKVITRYIYSTQNSGYTFTTQVIQHGDFSATCPSFRRANPTIAPEANWASNCAFMWPPFMRLRRIHRTEQFENDCSDRNSGGVIEQRGFWHSGRRTEGEHQRHVCESGFGTCRDLSDERDRAAVHRQRSERTASDGQREWHLHSHRPVQPHSDGRNDRSIDGYERRFDRFYHLGRVKRYRCAGSDGTGMCDQFDFGFGSR